MEMETETETEAGAHLVSWLWHNKDSDTSV